MLPAPGGPSPSDRVPVDRDDGTGVPYWATLGELSAGSHIVSGEALGDGAVDATAALQAIHDSAGAGGCVVYPAGFVFRTTDTITVPAGQSVLMYSPIIFAGAAAGYTKPIMVHGDANVANNMEGKRLRFWCEYDAAPSTTVTFRAWANEDAVGVRLYNLRNNGDTHFAAVKNCYAAVQLWANATPGSGTRSCAYNNLTFGELLNNRIHLHLLWTGGNVVTGSDYGWINQNTFIMNKCRNDSSRAEGLERYGIVVESRNFYNRAGNSNYFLRPSFELNPPAGTNAVPIVVIDAEKCVFEGVRCEESAPNHMVRVSGRVASVVVRLTSTSAGESREVENLGPLCSDVYVFDQWRHSFPWVERWRSGFLPNQTSDYDGAGSLCVRGFAQRRSSGDLLTVFRLHDTLLTLDPEYVEIPGTRALILRVRFVRGPKQVQLIRNWHGTHSGRLGWQCYDSGDNLIGYENVMPVSQTLTTYYWTGSISGTTLTITEVGAGAVALVTDGRQYMWGPGVAPGTRIVAQLTGTAGGIGTYEVNNSQSVPSTHLHGVIANKVGSGGFERYAEASDIGPILESQEPRREGIWQFSSSVAYVDFLFYGGTNPARLREIAVCTLPTTLVEVEAPGGLQKLYDSIPGLLATAPPSVGAWERGQLLYNPDLSAAGTEGWGCVTAGTPGTWKARGVLAA